MDSVPCPQPPRAPARGIVAPAAPGRSGAAGRRDGGQKGAAMKPMIRFARGEPPSPRLSVLQDLAGEFQTRLANARKGIPWREGRLAAFTRADQHGLAAVEQYALEQ